MGRNVSRRDSAEEVVRCDYIRLFCALRQCGKDGRQERHDVKPEMRRALEDNVSELQEGASVPFYPKIIEY